MSDKTIVRISDVMTPDVIVVARTATVREAVAEMRRLGTSSVVVDRRDEDDEYGLVTVKDIAQQVIGNDLSPDRVNVYEVMSKPVMALAAEMNIVYAVRMLNRFRLTRAMVIDHDRKPVGIVTLRDMVLRHIEDE